MKYPAPCIRNLRVCLIEIVVWKEVQDGPRNIRHLFGISNAPPAESPLSLTLENLI